MFVREVKGCGKLFVIKREQSAWPFVPHSLGQAGLALSPDGGVPESS